MLSIARSTLPRHSTAFALTLALAANPASADLGVVSVSPTANATAASTASAIHVVFDAALNPATVTDQLRVFGRWSGPVPGDIEVAGSEVRFVPDRPFFPAEYVTVWFADGVESAGGDGLPGGYTWSFFTTSRAGTGTYALKEVIDLRFQGEGGITSYGVYAGDLDGDGAPDLSIPNEASNDVRVLMNDGCGDYSDPVAYDLPNGSTPSSNEGADFDGDGDIDLVTANITGNAMSVLMGDGSGGYLPTVSYTSGLQPRGATVIDMDGDGDRDVAIAHRIGSDIWLHPNEGGTFGTPTQIEGGGSGETALQAADADGDGICDLFVGNFNSQTVTCLKGDGDGGFNVTGGTGIGGSPWMLAIGDVDGDGIVDVAGCNYNTDSAGVVRSDGAGDFFPAQVYPTGNFSLAIDLGDLNADGDLDLVASNYLGGDWTILENNGAGVFSNAGTLDATFAGSCATLVDSDRDGDVDIIGIDEISDEAFFYIQPTTVPGGVQLASCDATLRVDNLAGWAGFGSPAHTSTIGGNVYLGVSGPAGAPYAMVYGAKFFPSVLTDGGLLSLFPIVIAGGGVLDANGEANQRIAVPAGLTPGASAVVQGAVVDGVFPFGVGLTNPEEVEFQP